MDQQFTIFSVQHLPNFQWRAAVLDLGQRPRLRGSVPGGEN
jgi:hypothetical protein